MSNEKYRYKGCVSYSDAKERSLGRQRYLLCATVLFALVTCFHSVTHAEWRGGVEGGTVLRDSGTATRLRLTLRNDKRPLSHFLFAEWIRSDAVGNDLTIGYNPRFWIDSTYYVFGESSLRTVNTLGIERDLTGVAGMGGQFINQPEQSFFAEVGLGGRSIEFEGSEEANTETLGVARLGYNRVLVDAFRFDISIRSSFSSEDVNEATSEVGLSVRVPNGSIRLAHRNRFLQSGDADAISEGDTFISFGLGF